MRLLLLALALAPLLLLVVLLAFRYPMKLALPAYAAIIPFGGGLAVGLPTAFGSVSSLLGVLLAAALLVQLVRGGAGSPGITPALPFWLLFLGVAAASVFWSVAPTQTVNSFAILASLVVLYALLVISRIDREAYVRTGTALVVGGVAASCYGLAQLLFLGGLPAEAGHDPRFGNDLLGPNNQAVSLLLPFAVAVTRTVVWPRLAVRLAYFAAVLLIGTGIIMTGSRGGLLAVAATYLVLVLFADRGRRVLAGIGLFAAALLTVVLVTQPSGLGERQASEVDSSGRIDIWEIGLEACEIYCATGSGWGTFPTVYSEVLPRVPGAQVLEHGVAFEPHNIALLVAVEAGWLGLLLVGIALAFTLRDGFRLPTGLRGPPLAGLVGTLVAGVFLSNLEFKFFWMALIYIGLARNLAAAEAEALPNASSRPAEPPEHPQTVPVSS